MPRRNRRQRQTSRPPAAAPRELADETPEQAALRLVRTGKCSPAILDRRRLPFRLPGGTIPGRGPKTTGERDA